jgi:hypothetical protein
MIDRVQFIFLMMAILLVARPAMAADVDTRLVVAAEKSDTKALAELLKLGVDVNAAQVDGMTALDWAAFHDDAELAKKLITAGADAKAANRYGVSPLSLACTNGNTAIVELLLTAGADANTKLSGGETVLMTAARTGVAGPVESLIAHGADGDDGFGIGIELDGVAAPVPLADRAPQARDAARDGVAMRVQALRGFDQLVDDVLRRRPVGIAHRQVDHVLAAAARRHLQLVGDVEDVRRQPLDP